MDEAIKKLYGRQGYRLVGEHSAVKVCHWTKEKLIRNRPCYKQKFYGIASHRCLQMTPSVAWCQHKCLFCWRPMEFMGAEMKLERYDEPAMIAEESIKKQRALLSGYWGEKGRVDMQEVEEAHNPRHAAISLSGEPTNYPYLQELIEEYHKRGMTTFLVTNGQNPEKLADVKPTQLYLSLIAYEEELYKKINLPLLKDGWERLNRSLEIMGQRKDVRKVVRLTLVRGYNLEHPEKFAKLILKTDPDFVEPKGYVHVGYSRRRLEREHMPSFEEIMQFSKILSEEIGYEIKNKAQDSKVALLIKDGAEPNLKL